MRLDLPELAPDPPLPAFSPMEVWHVGQRWRTVARPSSDADGFDDAVKEYEVISIDREGATTIRVTSIGPSDPEQSRPSLLVFDSAGRRVGARDEPGYLDRVAWPNFPLTVTADGEWTETERVSQSVRQNGRIFTVMLEGDGGKLMNARAIFHWEVGRPWFDSWSAWRSGWQDPFFPVSEQTWEEMIGSDLEQPPAPSTPAASTDGALPFPRRWKKGQRWSSMLHSASERQNWMMLDYEVMDVHADGTVRIRATENYNIQHGTIHQYVEWTFDASGQIVSRSHQSAKEIRETNPAPDGPWYLYYEDHWPGAEYVWPQFPLTPSVAAAQYVRRDGETFRIELDVAKHRDLPEDKRFRAYIRWTKGRPWFETFRLEVVDPSDPDQQPQPFIVEHIYDWDARDGKQYP